MTIIDDHIIIRVGSGVTIENLAEITEQITAMLWGLA